MKIASVRAVRTVGCPAAAAQGYAEDFLASFERGEIAAVVRAGPLAHLVRLEFGLSSFSDGMGPRRDELRIAWSALTPLLPDFRGTIQVRSHAGRTELLLAGKYAPPGGRAGVLFDRIIGNAIAAATARDVLRRLALQIEARNDVWTLRVTAAAARETPA